jgi:hypothetical protein
MHLTYKPPRLISFTVVASFACEIISIFTVNTTPTIHIGILLGHIYGKLRKKKLRVFSLDVPEDSRPILL